MLLSWTNVVSHGDHLKNGFKAEFMDRCCRWWLGRTWRRSSCTMSWTGEWLKQYVWQWFILWSNTMIIIVGRTLAYADKDLDGRISFEEFESIIGKLGGPVHKKMVVQVWRGQSENETIFWWRWSEILILIFVIKNIKSFFESKRSIFPTISIFVKCGSILTCFRFSALAALSD